VVVRKRLCCDDGEDEDIGNSRWLPKSVNNSNNSKGDNYAERVACDHWCKGSAVDPGSSL
jgi:hypothetical protein